MRARTVLSIFCLVLAACGARSEIRGGLPDASTMDVIGDQQVTTSSCEKGLVQIAATGSQPDTIVLDGDWVYWHDATGIFRVKKTGGGPETLAQPAPYFWPDLAAFAVGGGNLFHGDGDAIVFQGTPIDKLASPGFASNASNVFAWSRDALPTPLIRYDFGGQGANIASIGRKPVEMTFTTSALPCVAEDPGVECGGVLLSGLSATDIAVDGDDVFFTSNDATNGARVMHLVMPSLKTAPIADTDGAFALAEDASDLFFTDGLGLRVRRIEGKTGPVADIASTPVYGPVDLVVDDTCVYWTASSRFDKTGSGWVMAAPKK
jgi:hypothetical protein